MTQQLSNQHNNLFNYSGVQSELSSQLNLNDSKYSCQSSTSTIGQLLSTLSNFKIKKIFKSSNSKTSKVSWSKAQTQQLIKLSNVYGSDFSTISYFMKKTRDQIKRRFRYLEKRNLVRDIAESRIL